MSVLSVPISESSLTVWVRMLHCRLTTRQTSGWWRTWTLWTTMWPHCSTCPATSLCQSSGRTVSCGMAVGLNTARESRGGGDFLLNVGFLFFLSFLFFLFSISLCFLSLFCFVFFTVRFVFADLCLDPLKISLVSSHFILCVTPSFSCLVISVSLGLRGKELSESLFLSAFSYPTFRLRWLDFFSFLAPPPCCLSDLFHFLQVTRPHMKTVFCSKNLSPHHSFWVACFVFCFFFLEQLDVQQYNLVTGPHGALSLNSPFLPFCVIVLFVDSWCWSWVLQQRVYTTAWVWIFFVSFC